MNFTEIITPTIEEIQQKLEEMFDISLHATTFKANGTYSLSMWSPFYLNLSWHVKTYRLPGEDQTNYYRLMIAKSDTSKEVYYHTAIGMFGDDWQTVVREMGRYCKLRKVEQQRLF